MTKKCDIDVLLSSHCIQWLQSMVASLTLGSKKDTIFVQCLQKKEVRNRSTGIGTSLLLPGGKEGN